MTTTTCSVTKKGTRVSSDHVNSLVKNYKQERWLDNSKKLGKPDALSTWYGLEELQQFLDEAKKHHADGIKMFYGVYPPDYEISELAGRQTVVLVATRKANNQPGAVNKAILLNHNGKKEMLAFNFGDICPPYCGKYPPGSDTEIDIELSNIGPLIIERNGTIEFI